MEAALLFCYEALTVFLPCAALLPARRRRYARPASWYAWLAAFAVYVLFTLHLTEAGTLWDGLARGFSIQPEQINLIPFSQEIDISYPANFLLFLPFGWLVPRIWKKWDSTRLIAAAAFCLSLLIEASQLLNARFSDVDDLIINTAGALIGYALFCRVSRPAERPRPDAPLWEMPLYMGVMLAGHFLLFNELAAAGALYGF